MKEQESKIVDLENGIRWVEYDIPCIFAGEGFIIPEHPGISPEHWGESTEMSRVRVKEYLPYQQI